jgi:putative ATP-dependent endonuclease of the OLD family
MRINSLRIRNFRTLEAIDLDFQSSYTAICGPNDCGKTNVVRAIRALMKEDYQFRMFGFGEQEEVSLKEDYPKWKDDVKPSQREIDLEISLTFQRDRDAGFFQFLTKQLSLVTEEPSIALSVSVTHRGDAPEPTVEAICLGTKYTGIDAQEVLKRLQSSASFLFHNSTQIDLPGPFRPSQGGYMRAVSPEHEALIASMKATVNRGLSKISKSHQQELEGLLGRLETKYRVALSMPAFDFASVPFNVTLGQKKFVVPLDDWGGGTKNRTLILLALFRAKQLSDSDPSAAKITPVIVVEEPESFLHPAAQAEFGRVLHDLADEFQVQVIATTHSPYLLNISNPTANILLSRRSLYKQLRQTERIDTAGDSWMKPFGLALGLESEEFKPWKELILSGSDSILLVEGETDKQYFEMLRGADHGGNRLHFTGDIVAYDGTGSLQNTVLLRFIKNRYRKLFVTYDLDAEQRLEKIFSALGLQKKEQFMPVGLNSAGKRNIEGLLPDGVRASVYGAHADLVQEATQGTKEEQDSARNKLKKHYLEEFQRLAKPGAEYFGNFYPLVRIINGALS